MPAAAARNVHDDDAPGDHDYNDRHNYSVCRLSRRQRVTARPCQGCDGICYPQTWLGDGQCDEIAFNCSAFGNDEGDCQALQCPLDMVEACDGTCYPSNQLANGHCDQPFNCSELASDAGDCSSQPLAHDFSVFDNDGPGIRKFRDCTPTKDCTPTRDCTPTDDCTSTRSCNITGEKDTRDCSRCLLSVFGHCVQPGNDPVCKAAKALQNVKYQAECAAKKLDCERLKTTEKLACEANKAAKKADCERIKAQDKLICEADKTAQKLDCERLKEVQKVGGEVVEAAIHYSQERALMEHPRSIPDAIRHALYPYFSAELLDSVVWTDDHGDIFSLQKFITEINERAAVTLGTVIVFKHAGQAASDIGLWAHELEHVKQYRLLGIDGFAQYYTFEYGLIESLATEQSRYVCEDIGTRAVCIPR